MFQISKKTQYGLRALVFLVQKNIKGVILPTSLKEIAKAEAIPFLFLEKIILDLKKHKIVKGKRGVGGGYVLAKNPKRISIRNVVQALEKTITPVNCSLCRRKRSCLSKNVWEKVEKSINKTLEKIKLSEIK